MRRPVFAIIAAMIVAGSSHAFAQSASAPSTDAILKRLDALERENRALHDEVRVLKRGNASTATVVPPPPAGAMAMATTPSRGPVYKAASAFPRIPYSWTGLYAGLNGGYAWGRGSTDFSGNSAVALQFAIGAFPSTLAPDPKGFFGGGQIGYNYQVSQWVFGIETDLAYADIQSSQVVTVPALGGVFTTSAESKLDAFGTFRVRLGVTPVERYLFYVTGGLAYGHAKLNASEITQIPGFPACSTIFDFCSSGSSSKWLGGWTAGGGFEFALSNNWSVKSEYLYYDLGSVATSFTAPNLLLPGIAFNASSEFRGHMFRAGLNYKFDEGLVVAKY